MKLKMNEEGHAVVSDGKPVFVKDDGTEIPFDAPGTLATISRLNGEAKGHREAKEAAQAELEKFAGIEDPAAALDAITKLKSLDDKKLIDAGEVDRVKAEAIKAVEAKYQPIVEERDTLNNQLRAEMIGGSFARSKFATEKLAIPADMVEARFGKHFGIEDSKIVAKDASGNMIYSEASPGEVAGFDEALSILVNAYPYKDTILKGSGSTGSGATGDAGGSNGAKTMTRVQFDALNAKDKAARMRDGFKVQDA